jgi:flagellar basal body-associated protein FliL
MADSDSKYKDSFISQEDIDLLMKEADSLGPEAFAGSDADAKASDVPSADTGSDDLISQDDIDALLSLADKGSSGNASEPEDDVISQEDIDALLEGTSTPNPPEPTPPDDDASDLDMVSEEDIEQLLRSESFDIPDTSPPEPKAEANGLDTITQEDLKDLSATSEIRADAGPDTDGDDDALISQDDIDALLSGAGAARKQAEPAPPKTEAPKAKEPEQPEPPEMAQAADESDEDSLISQEDIDSLLAGAEASEIQDRPGEPDDSDDSNLISQEDIDKLLLGNTEDKGTDDDLIGEEDIDRLLNATQPVDDEGLAGFTEQEKLISQEDIDQLLNEDMGEMEKDEDRILDQVVLEKSTDLDLSEEKNTSKTIFLKSKLFISAVAVALVLLVSVTALMLFSGKGADEVALKTPIPAETTPPAEEPLPDYIESSAPQTLDIVTVTMNDFVVPAPADIKGLSYIALSLTMEIADVSTNPVKDYEPFFRNIVYEVINKAFILQNESKIVEADLKKMIQDALNDALSEGSISSIEFLDFKVG